MFWYVRVLRDNNYAGVTYEMFVLEIQIHAQQMVQFIDSFHHSQIMWYNADGLRKSTM